MLNHEGYVYVNGDYFGEAFSKKHNINVKNTVFVGKVIQTFNMSNYNWKCIFWFFLNKKLWINGNHLLDLPQNSNIIYGLTYINNNKYFIKNNNKYLYNILDINENYIEKNIKSNLKKIQINSNYEFSLLNLTHIDDNYYT